MQEPSFDLEFGSPLTSQASTPPQTSQFEEVIINGSKMFSCLTPDCGKTFKYKSEMTRHIAIHLNQRPYVCTHPGCTKTFKRNDALTNHHRVHNKKAAYTCPVASCKSDFTTKSALRYHLLKHEGEKAFECSYPGCNQTFTTQNQLKMHEKTSCWRLKSEKATSLEAVCSPVVEMQKSVDLGECTKVSDYSTFAAFNKLPEMEFGEFDGKFEEFVTSEVESDRCSIPYNFNAKSDEAASTDLSEMSSMGKKSGRNLEDVLISLLTYMTEENQQLRKKLKYSNDILKGNLPEMNQAQDQSQYFSSEQEQFPDIHFDQDPVDIDSFFRSPLRLENDEDHEREFIF